MTSREMKGTLHPPTRRKLLRLASLALTTCGIGLAVCEAILRFGFGLGNPILIEPDAACAYILKPDQDVIRFSVHTHINHYGMRSDELPSQRAAGALRLLFVGDSITYGTTRVDQREIFTEILHREGFVPASGQFHEGLPFRKPVEMLANVRDLTLDAAGWSTADDVYDSFFEAVQAPAWHGRNSDALKDSIVTGGINGIEVPYRIIIKNIAGIQSEARETANQFLDLLTHFEAEGCPVKVLVGEPVL